MGEAIGQMLPFAVGIAISPLPIIAVVLILVSPRARTNGPAFVLGWFVGVAGVGVVLLAVAGVTEFSEDGGPATWLSWVKLLFGVGLAVLAVRQWRGRPEVGEDVPEPSWMAAIETFSVTKSATTGFLLAGLNPKNMLLILGGAADVAELGLSAAEEAVEWAVFTLLASVGVGAPVVLTFVLGDRAADPLERLKTWLIRHAAVILGVILLLLGAKLIGEAITSLTA
jgi:hypothetical protein